MASVYTNKGEEILIDDEDFDLVSQFTWYIDKSTGYPGAHKPGAKGGVLLLHSLLVWAPKGWDIDHKNRNKQDARKKNLEPVTHARNIQRQLKSPSAGVRKHHHRFKAYIPITENGKQRQVHLGSHKTFDHALLARIIGEIRYWGEPTQQMP